MPFVAAKCKQCGHNMQVDESLERGFCPACGTPYVKEDVVNNYNTYNTTNYQIEHADVVISDSSSIEKRLENAEVFLTVHHDFDKAAEIYKSVTEDAPADYRGWWGLVRAYTKNLNPELYYYYISQNTWDKSYPIQSFISQDFLKKAITVASEKERTMITEKWSLFQKKYEELRENKKRKKIEDLKRRSDAILDQISELNREANSYSDQVDSHFKKNDQGCLYTVIAFFGTVVLGFVWNPIWTVSTVIFIVGLIILGIMGLKDEIGYKTNREKEMSEISKKSSSLRTQSKQLQKEYEEIQNEIDELSRIRY